MAVETQAADGSSPTEHVGEEPSLRLEVDRERFVRKLVIALLAAEVAFVVLDWAVNYKEYVDSFVFQEFLNIASEDSLHNYVSSLQYLATGIVLFLVYKYAKQTGAPRSLTGRWAFATVFFVYLALDDGAAIHETVGTLLEDRLSFFPSYTWQVVYVPIFAVAALIVLRLAWRHLAGRRLRLLVLAGVLLWVAAVVLDYLEGRENLYTRLADAWALGDYTVFHYSRVIEEFVEDVAATLLLVAFLQHLLRTAPRISFTAR